MIKSLSPIFGSRTKAQEIALLLHDAKPVVRQGFYAQELPPVDEFCRSRHLFLVTSRFKVLLADNAIYSNKGIRMNETDPRPGMYFMYLSKDESKAWLASYYELMGKERELGLLLGYPACCVDFFCRSFNETHPNLEHPPTNPYTNVGKREQDYVLLSHFPCHSDCTESIILAKRYLDVLRKVDKPYTRELLEKLQG